MLCCSLFYAALVELCCSLFYAAFVEFSIGFAKRATTENERNLVDLYYSFIHTITFDGSWRQGQRSCMGKELINIMYIFMLIKSIYPVYKK